EEAVEREWRRSLLLGTLACSALLLGVMGVFPWPRLLLAGSAVAGWCFNVVWLGLARRFLNFGNVALHYLSEAALPIYILHQAAIVIPGYLLIQLPVGIAAKFFLLLGVSVLLTFAVYHFAVRPFAAMRFLFGMRPKSSVLGRPRAAIAA